MDPQGALRKGDSVLHLCACRQFSDYIFEVFVSSSRCASTSVAPIVVRSSI